MKNLKFLVALLLAINFFGLTACDEQPLGSTDRPATDMTFTVEYRNHGPKTSYGTLGTEKFHTMSSTDTFVSYTLEHYDVSGTLLGTQTNTSLKFRYANVPGGTVWTVLKGTTLSGSVRNLDIISFSGVAITAYMEIGTWSAARFDFVNRSAGTAPSGTAQRDVPTNLSASFTIETSVQNFSISTEAPISETRQFVGSSSGSGKYTYTIMTTGQRANGASDTVWSTMSVSGKIAGVEVASNDQFAFLYDAGVIQFLLNGRSVQTYPAASSISFEQASNSELIVKMARRFVADSSATIKIKFAAQVGSAPTVTNLESSIFVADTVYHNMTGLSSGNVVYVLARSVDVSGNFTSSTAQYIIQDLNGDVGVQYAVNYITEDESGNTLPFAQFVENGNTRTGGQTVSYSEGALVNYALLQSVSPAGDTYYPVTSNGQFTVSASAITYRFVYSAEQQQTGDISNLNIGSITQTSAIASWTNPSRSDVQNVYVRLDGGNPVSLAAGSTGYTFTNLSPNTLYSVQVSLLLTGGSETNGQIRSFTTLNQGGQPPAGPDSLYVQDASDNVEFHVTGSLASSFTELRAIVITENAFNTPVQMQADGWTQQGLSGPAAYQYDKPFVNGVLTVPKNMIFKNGSTAAAMKFKFVNAVEDELSSDFLASLNAYLNNLTFSQINKTEAVVTGIAR